MVVRQIYMYQNEPDSGAFTWTDAPYVPDNDLCGPNDYMTNAQAYQLNSLFEQGGVPSWAYTGQIASDEWGSANVINKSAWSTYWSTLAAHCMSTIHDYVIFGECYLYPIQESLALHSDAMQAIKSQDPNAIAIANVVYGDPGFDGSYLQALLAAGLDSVCDVVSSDPYYDSYLGAPEIHMALWTTTVMNEMAVYRSNWPFWWTEYGWYGNDEVQPGHSRN